MGGYRVSVYIAALGAVVRLAMLGPRKDLGPAGSSPASVDLSNQRREHARLTHWGIHVASR